MANTDSKPHPTLLTTVIIIIGLIAFIVGGISGLLLTKRPQNSDQIKSTGCQDKIYENPVFNYKTCIPDDFVVSSLSANKELIAFDTEIIKANSSRKPIFQVAVIEGKAADVVAEISDALDNPSTESADISEKSATLINGDRILRHEQDVVFELETKTYVVTYLAQEDKTNQYDNAWELLKANFEITERR